MLRITVHDKPQTLTFQLEGKLSAPSLRKLEDCWKSTLGQPHTPNLCIDLAGVTFIDDAGKACLTAMHHQGAEFIAADRAQTRELPRSPRRRRPIADAKTDRLIHCEEIQCKLQRALHAS